jgi:hypothetical protein
MEPWFLNQSASTYKTIEIVVALAFQSLLSVQKYMDSASNVWFRLSNEGFRFYNLSMLVLQVFLGDYVKVQVNSLCRKDGRRLSFEDWEYSGECLSVYWYAEYKQNQAISNTFRK